MISHISTLYIGEKAEFFCVIIKGECSIFMPKDDQTLKKEYELFV